MGPFDGSSGDGGFMGLLANPQTAGLLGMAGGLLQASGPSRIPVSMGQAMGAGLQGMGQGAAGAMNTQRQMLQMQAMQGLMGMGQGAQSAPASSAAPASPSYSTMFGTSTPTAAQMPQGQPAPANLAPPAGGTIYGKTPQQLFQQGMLMNMAGIQGGGDLMRVAVEHDPTLAMQMPTDITKMGYQGGLTPDQIQAANAAGVAKANYIAPVNARPGAILRNPLTMQPMAFNPNIPAGGTPVFDASGNVVGINSIPGAAGVTADMAAAKAGGEGSMLPYAGVDANGNPLPVTNRTAAASGGMPAPLRNNNPGALMPGGQLAQYPDMQTGLAQLDNNLQSYGKQGVNTLAGVISKWAPPNENNTQAYIQDVSQRLGVKPDQPIDLSNPAVRQAISTGIMLHENGPGAVFGSGAPAHTPIYAAAPLGATTAANVAQGAPAQQMEKAHGALSDADDNYQQSREVLQQMLGMAKNQGIGDFIPRMMPADYASKISGDAATYQKLQANFIAMQGKALGNAGTDASRETLENSVPGFDKPQSAKLTGLTDQLNQLDWRHVKRQALSPVFQVGDPKQYTQLSAQFDNTVTPSMMPKLLPFLSAPPSPARTQALQQAIQDPKMKAALDLMVRTGQLK
jgi:hypothetical protein